MIGNTDSNKAPRMSMRKRYCWSCQKHPCAKMRLDYCRFLEMELRLRNFTAVDKGRALHVTMHVGWRFCLCFVRFLHQGAISLSVLQAYCGFLEWACLAATARLVKHVLGWRRPARSCAPPSKMLWVPCGFLAGCVGCPTNWHFQSKTCKCYRSVALARKQIPEGIRPARLSQEVSKKATKEPQKNDKPQQYPHEKNKHDVNRTSARVKPRSLAEPTSKSVVQVAWCGAKREL